MTRGMTVWARKRGTRRSRNLAPGPIGRMRFLRRTENDERWQHRLCPEWSTSCVLVNLSVVYFQWKSWRRVRRVQNISKSFNMVLPLLMLAKQRTRWHLRSLFKPVFFRRLLSGKRPVIIMTLSMKVFGVFFKVLLMMPGRFYRSASRCRDILKLSTMDHR